MNDDLQTYIEPDVEARLVALVLGEASAFETEELERLMAERPEVKACKERLQKINGVLAEAHRDADGKQWRLSEKRRAKVLAKVEAKQKEQLEKKRNERVRKGLVFRRALYSLAACLVVGLITALVYQLGDHVANKWVVAEASGDSREQVFVTRGDGRALNIQAQEDFDAKSMAIDEQSGVRFARQRLSELEKTRGVLEQEMSNENPEIREALQKQMEETDQQIDRLGSIVNERTQETYSFSSNLETSARQGQLEPQVRPSASPTPEQTVSEGEIAAALADLDESMPSSGDLSGLRRGTLSRKTEATQSAFPVTPATPSKPGEPSPPELPNRVAGMNKTTGGYGGGGGGGFDRDDQKAQNAPFGLEEEENPKPELQKLAELEEAESAPPILSIAGVSTPERTQELERKFRSDTLGNSKGKVIAGRKADDVTSFGADGVEFAGGVEAEKKDPKGNYFRWSPKDRDRTRLEKGELRDAVSNDIVSGNEGTNGIQTEALSRAGGLPEVNERDGGLKKNLSRFRFAADGNEGVELGNVPAGRAGKGPSWDFELTDSANQTESANKLDFGFDSTDKDSEGGDELAKKEVPAGTNFFLGGGTVGREAADRNNTDFISPVEGVTIPGIPDSPQETVRGIVTGGNRSGAAAVTRNSIDGILDESVAGEVSADDPFAPADAFESVLPDDEEMANSGGGLLLSQEEIRRPGGVVKSDEHLMEARKAYQKGIYDDAVQKYREALNHLPYGESTKERREFLYKSLSDGSVALAQEYRRKGRYDEARELLDEATRLDPGNEAAETGLEYLDDPIRTNPSLTYEHSENLDKVRRNLYKGEGYYDLGLYDKADEEFKKVLRTDPYNKAARRWLERTAGIKSDYYRAAYDQTRAEMLMEVDRAWELGVPMEVKPQDPSHGGPEIADFSVAETTLTSKLNQIVLPKLQLQNTTVAEALEVLRVRSRELDLTTLDNQKKGVNLVVDNPELLERKLPNLALESITLKEALKSIADKTGNSVIVDQFAVRLGDGDSGGRAPADEFKEVDAAVTSAKLKQTIIPEIDFKNTSLADALKLVEQRTRELDNTTLDDGKRGVNIEAQLPGGSPGLGGGGYRESYVVSELKLKNVPAETVLEYLAEISRTQYQIGKDGKVTFKPLVVEDGADLIQKQWKVSPEFLDFLGTAKGRTRMVEDPFSSEKGRQVETEKGLGQLLIDNGVRFDERIGFSYLKDSGVLIARASPSQLEVIDQLFTAYEEDKAKEEAEKKRRTERENFETSTAKKSDSTFSLNVSDVSFKLAKAALAEGKRPEVARVRPEEFFNALEYGDERPTQAEKVACAFEQSAHPFLSQRNLMRISMSTASLGRNAATPLRLTLLLDQSGSMERADRAESVKRAFALLAAQLTPNDEVTLIGFARTPRLLAERVKGNEAGKLAAIVANPITEGGTNLEEALSTGIQLAKQQYLEGAQNRIILLTDGAANLGDARPETLVRQVESMRAAGIAFDACGVGADGLNDEILSSLAKEGDGRYYFLDRPEDADEGFARQIAGALRPAASNVKVQVLFNPERVKSFYLYGFEKHELKKEDFRNDSVDAAEMAAEESGVALYHFEPLPDGRGDVGTVSVRFLDTASQRMVERTWALPYEPEVAFFNEAERKLRLASVAGLFAEKLRESPVGERVELKRLRQELEVLKPTFGDQTRFQELQTMLRQAGE